LEGNISNGSVGAGEVAKLAFSLCSAPDCQIAISSSASAANPWQFTATPTTAGIENTNGILDIANPTIVINCFVACKWTSESVQAHLTGGERGTLSLSGTILPKEEGLPEVWCGSKVDFSATYTVTTPSSITIE
jgi:hypothetical protein